MVEYKKTIDIEKLKEASEIYNKKIKEASKRLKESAEKLRQVQSVLKSGLTIGEQIAYVRKTLGLTQQQVCYIIGMAQTQLARYENDSATPRAETLNKIADALNCYVVWDNEDGSVYLHLKDAVNSEYEKDYERLIEVINQLPPKYYRFLLSSAEGYLEASKGNK